MSGSETVTQAMMPIPRIPPCRKISASSRGTDYSSGSYTSRNSNTINTTITTIATTIVSVTSRLAAPLLSCGLAGLAPLPFAASQPPRPAPREASHRLSPSLLPLCRPHMPRPPAPASSASRRPPTACPSPAPPPRLSVHYLASASSGNPISLIPSVHGPFLSFNVPPQTISLLSRGCL